MSQAGRTIMVTGASRGIGRAIAEKLLREECHVIGIGRTFDDQDQTLTSFTPVPLDMSRIAELPVRLKELRQQHPEIDGLVCNAGYGRFGSLEEFSAAQIQQLVDTNLTSQILIAREFLPLFKARGRGDLIFMGSEAALKGGGRGAVYSATKFALRGLAQSLREECAGTGVRVGIINPGMVQTGFFDQLDFRPGDTHDSHLVPGDIADAVWLMLSARPGATIDEINLSPHKRTIQFRKAE